LDVAKLSPAERKQVANCVALYKQDLRTLISQGDLYRLESPYAGPRAALDFVSPDQTKAVLFVYQLKACDPVPLKLRGLDPQKQSRLRELNLVPGTQSTLSAQEQSRQGSSLMTEGLVPPVNAEFTSSVVELTAE